jgi:AcrR family transcriptional regulator
MRQRILRAATSAAASHGHSCLTVASVVAEAGISRSTFYEHFSDLNECVLAAIDSLGVALIDQLESALAEEAEPGTGTVIEALCRYTREDPDGSRMLFLESLAAGSASLDRREHLQRELAMVLAAASPAGEEADPAAIASLDAVAGGLLRLFAIRLRRGLDEVDELSPADLAAWVEAYVGVGLGYGLGRLSLGERDRPGAEPAWELRSPPADRHLTGKTKTGVDQELRIITATARLSYESGYRELTVSDITTAAHVSRNAFYRSFRDKPDAASLAIDLMFDQVMSGCAAAYFSAKQWPERVWRAGRAFAEAMAGAPSYSYLSLVETHAIGRQGCDLVYERMGAFALFLEEGFRYRPEAKALPKVSAEVIGAAIFEVGSQASRRRRTGEWHLAALPQLTFLCLAPFLGPEAAVEFVREKTAELRAG